MATMIRLTQDQIDYLLDEADGMESALKGLHEELVEADIPKDTLTRFTRLHDRFTDVINFLRRQRELGAER
jgi:hypothetical protein